MFDNAIDENLEIPVYRKRVSHDGITRFMNDEVCSFSSAALDSGNIHLVNYVKIGNRWFDLRLIADISIAAMKLIDENGESILVFSIVLITADIHRLPFILLELDFQIFYGLLQFKSSRQFEVIAEMN